MEIDAGVLGNVTQRVADTLRLDLLDLLAVVGTAGHDLRTPRMLSLTVADEASMTDLHARSHGVATPTDVLTWELDHHEEVVTEAEVVVCLDVALREASQRGHEVRTELLLYALHGLLHVSGHDDTTSEASAAMHAAEDDLLERGGFGRPFAGRGRAGVAGAGVVPDDARP